MSEPELKSKKKFTFRVPHAYVLIFIVILIVAAMTYFVPAGQFERVVDEVTGRTVVLPGSFTYVEQQPISIFDTFKSFQLGLLAAADIVFFCFLIGGAFGIINATGAIAAGLNAGVKALKGRTLLVIPGVTFLFSLLGASFGFYEEMLPFVPISVALAVALGYDRIIGVGMVLLGVATGFAFAPLNPFTVGVAQGIAELPIFSGLGVRLILYVLAMAITIHHLYRYAKRVKEDPDVSLAKEIALPDDTTTEFKMDEDTAFTNRQKLVLVTLLIGLVFLVFGVLQLDWYINEIATLFLIIGIVSGFIGALGPNKIAGEFIKGAAGLTFGALVIGLARSIVVVMEAGMIIDTVIFSLAQPIGALHGVFSAMGMVVVQGLLNFFIPSGSGQAAATMPIMIPLSDIIGVNRQVAVLAFQVGDGVSNMIYPTLGATMAALSLGNVPWDVWAKFAISLVIKLYIFGLVAVTIAHLLNFGPF